MVDVSGRVAVGHRAADADEAVHLVEEREAERPARGPEAHEAAAVRGEDATLPMTEGVEEAARDRSGRTMPIPIPGPVPWTEGVASSVRSSAHACSWAVGARTRGERRAVRFAFSFVRGRTREAVERYPSAGEPDPEWDSTGEARGLMALVREGRVPARGL